MTHQPLKFAAITTIALIASAGTAFAAGGENCKDKKKTAMKAEATAGQTAVLSAVERKAVTGKTVYSFDDALALCTKKGAKDLQACIDYKTGKVSAMSKTAPKS